MIDKDTKNIEKVKNEIEQWEKSADKHGRLYLVVTVQRDGLYDYYCHYFYRNGMTNGVNLMVLRLKILRVTNVILC